MHRLDRIGRVDGGSDILRVFKIGRQSRPFIAAGFNDDRVFLAPLGLQLIQRRFSRTQGSRSSTMKAF